MRLRSDDLRSAVMVLTWRSFTSASSSSDLSGAHTSVPSSPQAAVPDLACDGSSDLPAKCRHQP